MNICVYMYIYIYMYTFIYIYIYLLKNGEIILQTAGTPLSRDC